LFDSRLQIRGNGSLEQARRRGPRSRRQSAAVILRTYRKNFVRTILRRGDNAKRHTTLVGLHFQRLAENKHEPFLSLIFVLAGSIYRRRARPKL